MVMCQCVLIDCNKEVGGGANGAGGYEYVGVWVYGNSVYLLLSFDVSLKFLLELKFIN